MRRNPGPGGRPGFSLIELVVVIWVLGLLLAVAAPTIGSSRDSARVRYAAGSVAQEIRLAGQLAFSHGRTYTLDSASQADALIRTPLGQSPEVVLDLEAQGFRSVLIPNTTYPYTSTLQLDSSGDSTSSVAWRVVSGSVAATVSQPTGVVNPSISSLTKPSAADTDKFKLRILISL